MPSHIITYYQNMQMNINYARKNQPIKMRGQSHEINAYVHELKKNVSNLESQVADLTTSNVALMHENNILKGKLDIIRKEQERKALEVFKNQNAERKARSEQIRAYLGHDYESDDDE